MRNTDLLMVLALAAGVFMLAKSTAGAKKSNGETGSKMSAPGSGGATLIQEYGGWKYYSDGTAIDAFGNYYFQGVKVYDSTWGAVGS